MTSRRHVTLHKSIVIGQQQEEAFCSYDSINEISTVSTKRNKNFSKTFCGVEIIDGIDYFFFQWLCNSIKNLNNRVLSQIGRRPLILGQNSKSITFYPKNSFK